MSRTLTPRALRTAKVRRLIEAGTLDFRSLRRTGFNTEVLIAESGCPPAILSDYLNGSRRPAPWLQQRIATALGVQSEEIWPQRFEDEPDFLNRRERRTRRDYAGKNNDRFERAAR